MPVEPNAKGSWRRHLERLEGYELVNLREELDEILESPAMKRIRGLLIEAHDELVDQLINGPIQPLPIVARRTGVAAGLAGFDELVSDIRRMSVEAEKRMQLQAERLREEVR